MQKIFERSGVLQKARAGTGKRRKEQSVIRKSGAADKKAAPSISRRFHTVNFLPKNATDILFSDNKSKLYNDLFECYSKYYQLTNLKPTEEDFLSGTTSVKDAYESLKNAFSLLVDSNAQFQVDKDDHENYFFIIYQECSWDDLWHMFEVKPIIENIKEDYNLLHVFYAFLKMFSRKSGVDLWWRGDMSYAHEYLEEQINNLEDEKDGLTKDEDIEYIEDQILQIQTSLEVYNSGPAYASQQLIKNACEWEPDELIEEINSLESTHPLIDIMIEGCELCSHGNSTSSYYYNPDEGEEFNGESLHFEQQFSIIWDSSDRLTEEQCDLIDSNANEGCDLPYSWLKVNTNTDRVFKSDTWLPLIDKFFEHTTEVVRKLSKNE